MAAARSETRDGGHCGVEQLVRQGRGDAVAQAVGVAVHGTHDGQVICHLCDEVRISLGRRVRCNRGGQDEVR